MSSHLERRSVAAAFLAAAFMFALPLRAGAGPEKTAVILSTSSVSGETISCGCKKKDLGGIARKATVVKGARAENESVLLVDAGDFGPSSGYDPWMRTEFVWETMKTMGYDVVTPGPNEMTQGIEPIQNLFATAPEIQVVSANVTDKSGNLLWPEYTLLEKGGITYGVTGVTDKAYYSYNISRGLTSADEFNFKDLKESLKQVVPQIRSQADVVIVLLHTGAADAERVIQGLEGIDVTVVGHSPGYQFLPERIGENLLIKAGNRGQYVNVLELTLDPEKGVVDYNGEALAMGDTVEEDPGYKKIVDSFDSRYEELKKAAGETDKAEKK